MKLKITLTKSTIARLPKHKKTIEALGLRKIGKFVIHEDNAALRGQIAQVSYMLKVEEINE